MVDGIVVDGTRVDGATDVGDAVEGPAVGSIDGLRDGFDDGGDDDDGSTDDGGGDCVDVIEIDGLDDVSSVGLVDGSADG